MRRILQGVQRSRRTTLRREIQPSEFIPCYRSRQPRLQPPLCVPAQLELCGLFVSVHAALWRTPERPSPSGISRGSRNQSSHAVFPKPPSSGRGPHHDSWTNWSRKIVPSELSYHQSPEIRSVDLHF